eukprot:TRINITY_DN65272_c0_g1_i6.p5 TRINITY_DN65272_c0_g1~~TRINITY_DN65272_c0_g1_i6.p5  ORF type:complete len:110 (-),score=3.57 TRINITY_DN65272_c0_g1_i6:318-647(-)
MEGIRVLGGIKYGLRQLYLYDENGMMYECKSCPCVLDFYVHESCQRQGVGKLLFDHLLQAQNKQVTDLAFDRPSKNLLSFLDKHYKLKSGYLFQPNNFLVFNELFTNMS